MDRISCDCAADSSMIDEARDRFVSGEVLVPGLFGSGGLESTLSVLGLE